MLSHGLDLQEGLKDGGIIDKMLSDPIFLVDTLYVICKSQADEREISDEDFGIALGTRDAITSATYALIEGLKSFFPNQSKVISLAMEKIKLVQDRMSEEMIKRLEELDVEKMTSLFGKSLTDALEPSVLIRDRSHSES